MQQILSLLSVFFCCCFSIHSFKSAVGTKWEWYHCRLNICRYFGWIDKYCSEFVNSNNISTNIKTAVCDYYPSMIWSIDHVQKLTFLDHSWSYWAITLDHKMVWKGWVTLENIVESTTDPGIGHWNLIHNINIIMNINISNNIINNIDSSKHIKLNKSMI